MKYIPCIKLVNRIKKTDVLMSYLDSGLAKKYEVGKITKPTHGPLFVFCLNEHGIRSAIGHYCVVDIGRDVEAYYAEYTPYKLEVLGVMEPFSLVKHEMIEFWEQNEQGVFMNPADSNFAVTERTKEYMAFASSVRLVEQIPNLDSWKDHEKELLDELQHMH